MSDIAADQLALSQSEVRQIDAAAVIELGITGLMLMENAARGVSDCLKTRFPTAQRVLILCGTGNNGGDGLALTRQLAATGTRAETILLTQGKELTGDAQANLKILQAAGIEVQQPKDSEGVCEQVVSLTGKDVIVDCLLGTGMRGAVRSPMNDVIPAINRSAARVLAVDVPSGMNSDHGSVSGICIQADATVTFVGWKTGFLNPEAARFLGQVEVAHIGLPLFWVRQWLQSQRCGDGPQ